MDGELRRQELERRVRRLETRVHDLELRLEVSSEAVAPDAPPTPVPMTVSTPAPVHVHAAPPTPVTQPPRPMPAPAPWTADVQPPDVSRSVAGPPRTTWTQPPQPAPAHPVVDLRDLEERFAGRALAWIGGLALVAAAIFFLSLAFSRGWISEELRVGIGLVAGAVALGVGALCFDRRAPLLGNVITAVGLGVVSIALFAATRGYGLVPAEVGLLGALVAAIAAAAIAIRYDAREVAAFGLVAALIAPPVMGAEPTTLTLLFVAVTLVGTTTIALFRSWRWLPAIAFLLTVPQLAQWLVSDPVPWQAIVALAGFWLVNVVAAAGEELRIRRDDLRPSSASLVLANAAYLLWGGNVVLSGDLAPWLGTFIALASLAHLAIGEAFLRRQGMQHLFGNLVAGTGVALLALAAFVQLGTPMVPVAWAAEAVALAWLAVRRRHSWSALAAIALGSLAILHLLAVEYPVDQAAFRLDPAFATPWLHPEAAALAAVLLGLALAAVLAPVRWVRSALVGAGVVLAVYAATFEVVGPTLAAVLVVLAMAGLVLDRVIDRAGTLPTFDDVASWSTFAWWSSAAAAVAGATSIAMLVATEYPVGGGFAPAGVPYADSAALSLAIVLAGLGLGVALVGVRGIRSVLAGIAVLVVTWTLPFELADVAFIAVAAVLLPVAIVGDHAIGRLRGDPRFAALTLPGEMHAATTGAGIVPWCLGAGSAVAGYLSVRDWGQVAPPAIPFSDERALVAALLAGTAVAAASWTRSAAGQRVALCAAIVAGALVVPFEVYADGVVVLWLALAGLAAAVARPTGSGRLLAEGLAMLLGAAAAVVAFGIVAPPDRLWVVDPVDVARAPLLAGWPLAFVALSAALYLAPRHPRLAPHRAVFEVAAVATAVYAASVAVVDVFQRMAGGSIPVEELAKQAQVALSVCWTAIGAAALGWGLYARHPMARHIGLGLLALATAKVFAVDLAAMDVAYRALVLAGLGVLLLVSAWLFTHLHGPRSGPSGLHGPRPAG